MNEGEISQYLHYVYTHTYINKINATHYLIDSDIIRLNTIQFTNGIV